MKPKWGVLEIEYLVKHYPRLGAARLSVIFGRHSQTIWAKANKLGLTYQGKKSNAVYAQTPAEIYAEFGIPPFKRESVSATSNRACLNCGRSFQSWGVGNRLCSPCKTSPMAATPW